jgi:hypothetical protein
MNATIETESQSVTLSAPTVAQRSHAFFVVVAFTMFAALLAAFGPTFFLRPFPPVPPIPVGPLTPYITIHGVVLTAWFALFCAQTCLVAAGRTDLHRRLGVVAVIVAIAFVVITPVVNFQFVPRALALGVDVSRVRSMVFGNLGTLIVFPVLVATAVKLRSQPESHKRLMLLACFSLFAGPATDRLTQYLGIHDWFNLPFLVALLVGYDLCTIKRVHSATSNGGLLVLGVRLLSTYFATSEMGRALIDALR